MRSVLAIVLAAGLFLVAGCGGDEEATPTDTGTETAPVQTTDVSAYWLLNGNVWPALREVPETAQVGQAALDQLLAGPTQEEQDELSFSTSIPEGAEVELVSVEDGVAHVDISEELAREPLAQVVYTVSQFPSVESVEIAGESYTRSDFEDLTPAILVESPRFFEEVGNPVRATGTANTFEATFQYELTDTDGRIVDEGFVTATSGTGTRGTFDFTTDRYEIPFDGVGALIVYELSAEDGQSRLHLVEIPVKMSE